MISRWIKSDTTPPSRNGKYWVYPYISVEGGKYVTLARFEDGDWDEKYNNQHFQYWQKVEVPDPPRLRE
jgi:hypothetical protein